MIIVCQAISIIACIYVLFLASSIAAIGAMAISGIYIVAAVLALRATSDGKISFLILATY